MRSREFGLHATAAELAAKARVILLQPDYEQMGRSIFHLLNEIGEFELARQLLENMFPRLKDISSQSPSNYRGIQTDYLVTLYYVGETDRARQLAHIVLEQNKGVLRTGMRNKGIDDAICYLVLGETERAIQEIEVAYKDGWRSYYRNRGAQQLIFEPIMDDPRILQVKQDTDQFLDQQRPLVLKEMEQAGVFTAAI